MSSIHHVNPSGTATLNPGPTAAAQAPESELARGAQDLLSARSQFVTWEHGFPFGNAFHPGRAVLSIPTPWGTIPVGDLANGLCGGFVFTALDYYHHRRPVPRSFDEPHLFHYLRMRLWNSFGGPVSVSRIYAWTCRSGPSVHRLTAQQEWPALMRRIETERQPVPLMLIRPHTRKPWEIGKNHQVLATGYDYYPGTGRAVVHLYDPNHPIGRESDPQVTLTFDTNDFTGKMTHSREGDNVRGFFANHYRAKTPPR